MDKKKNDNIDESSEKRTVAIDSGDSDIEPNIYIIDDESEEEESCDHADNITEVFIADVEKSVDISQYHMTPPRPTKGSGEKK